MTTVLVIDDEQSIRMLMTALLEDEGYAVLQAADGYEGLRILEHERPDAIILDIMMPGIDGSETYQRIRSMSEHDHVPVIMVSAGAYRAPDKVAAFIRKPFNLNDLLDTLERVLSV